MKMKEFGPPGGVRVPGAPPWIRQCKRQKKSSSGAIELFPRHLRHQADVHQCKGVTPVLFPQKTNGLFHLTVDLINTIKAFSLN